MTISTSLISAVALMAGISTDIADQAATLIRIDENRPRIVVNRSAQHGRFPDLDLNYSVTYSRSREAHNFTLIANARQARIIIPIAMFPNLDINKMRVTTNSPSDPTLVVSMEYGNPIEGCFRNGAPRESLIFAFETQLKVKRYSYEDCESRLIEINDRDIRVESSGN